MKFLIATGIYPPEIGGPATVIAELVRQLKQEGEQVEVVTYGPTHAQEGEVIRVARQGSVFQRYLRFTQCVRELLDDPACVVVVTDVFSVGIPVRLALIGKRNPFVVRLGGEWCWEDAVTSGRIHAPLRVFWKNRWGGIRQWLMRWNYRWTLRRAARIAVTSPLLQEIVVRIVPSIAGRLFVIPNNSPCSFSSGTLRVREVHQPLRVLYVGRFAPVKNVPFFARVLRRLWVGGVSVSGTFVGNGIEMLQAKEALREIPGHRFLGALPHRVLAEQYAEADVCVLPSLTDICPNSVLEALASGLPCVMTKEHGLPRPLEGVVEVDPLSEEAWADALKRLTDPCTYRELASRVRPVTHVSTVTLFELLVGRRARDERA